MTRARASAAVLWGGLLAGGALLGAGCSRESLPPSTTFVWLAGRPQPRFDPAISPDPLLASLERLLSRGLTDEDSSGAVVPAAAERWEWSADSLALTLHLRHGLRFADGSLCGSADFQRALESGLDSRSDGRKAWLLGAVAGVRDIRPGRAKPRLGFAAPDANTLVIRLGRRDPLLPHKLALPGVSMPWSAAGPEGQGMPAGIGPYRVARAEEGRTLVLARRAGFAGPDSIVLRFQPAAFRVVQFLRGSNADLIWPLPAGLDVTAVPEGYRLVTRAASPARWLLLVMRADLPPTSRLATRHALAHAVNRDRVLEALGSLGRPLGDWPPGAGPFEFPALDEDQVREWMQRAKLGQAFHVVLAYDADGPAARVARVLQGEWSRLGIYAELRPLRGGWLAAEMLGGLSHLALVEAQPWSDDLAGTLALLVMPLRGPATSSFRTGWRTREFDGWLAPAPGLALPGPEVVQARLRDELIALPLTELPWAWLARGGGPPPAFHPRFGPGCPMISRPERADPRR